MNCRRLDFLLSKQLDGRLPERDAAEVAAHLRGCPVCRHLQEEMQVVRADVRLLAGLPMVRGVESRVAERWLQERAAGGEYSRAPADFGRSGARRSPAMLVLA